MTLWPFNPLNAELNPICYLLALLGAHHFLHVSRTRVKRALSSITDTHSSLSTVFCRHLLTFISHTSDYSFIHSIGMCRMWRFLAVLRSFFHSCLLCTFSCYASPPTICPSSLTSSCLLFLVLPLNLVPKFMYGTLLGILFSSILCTCPNQHNLFNLIVSIIVGFLTLA